MGKATMEEYKRSVNTHQAYWHVRCDCGNESIVSGLSLRRGATRSCGCLRAEASRARMLCLEFKEPAKNKAKPAATKREIKVPLVDFIDTAARIEARMDHGQAIQLREIRHYNELCYKCFPEEQDGAEFEEGEETHE
jgi:hypothetical protein